MGYLFYYLSGNPKNNRLRPKAVDGGFGPKKECGRARAQAETAAVSSSSL